MADIACRWIVTLGVEVMNEGKECQHLKVRTKMSTQQRRLRGVAIKVVRKSNECNVKVRVSQDRGSGVSSNKC